MGWHGHDDYDDGGARDREGSIRDRIVYIRGHDESGSAHYEEDEDGRYDPKRASPLLLFFTVK